MRTPIPYSKHPRTPPLTDAERAELDAELEAIRNMKDEDIDFSDIPEMTEEDFKRGHFFYQQPIDDTPPEWAMRQARADNDEAYTDEVPDMTGNLLCAH